MHQVKVKLKNANSVIFTFDDSKIISLKFSNQVMDDTFNMNPCVIEQYADITIKDYDKNIRNSIQHNYVHTYLDVEVYIDDVLFNTYITSTWDIKLQSSNVAIHCIDAVKQLENYQTELVDVGTYSLGWLLNNAFAHTPYNYTFEDLDLQHECFNIMIYNTYIQYQNIYELLNKLCLVNFLRIYWNKDTFVIARCW